MNTDLHSRIDYQTLLIQVGQDLPTIPTVLEELSAMLKDGNSSTQSVREMMVSDPTMTMKILRVANNVYLSRRPCPSY